MANSHIRLVRLGDNPLPDVPDRDRAAALALIDLATALRDVANVVDLVCLHCRENLNGVIEDGMVARLVAYALREDQQAKFLQHVRDCGGRAGFATSVDEALAILEGQPAQPFAQK